MALFGPAIPTAILLAPEGRAEVHPAAEGWWQNIITLRQASQQDRLRCPDCDQRLVYICEGVATPHFKHYRDTEGCTEATERDPERQARRANAWFRHQLVVGFRRALPPGTEFDCGQYLANRSSEMTVRLPDGRRFLLDVVAQPPDMSALAAQEQADDLPRFRVFVGKRVPGAVRGAATVVRIADGLNADHLKEARPSRVDLAHAARHSFYNLSALTGAPATLLFYLPGHTQEEPCTLALLRGLMPNPAATCWHGTLIKVALTEGAHVRFSLRHGFYTDEDLQVLDYHRSRLRLAPGRLEGHGHPLDRLWHRRQAELEAIRHREEERAAAERRAAERIAQAERTYGVLLSVLRHEGLSLLQGRPLPVPRPDLYGVPPADWQARLLGFVHRAGVAFTLQAAARWLRARGYVRCQNPPAELENLRAFWQRLSAMGLVAYESDSHIVPLKRYVWPVTGSLEAGAPALCLMCATVHAEPDLHLTEQWRVYDPAYGICKCLDCPAE